MSTKYIASNWRLPNEENSNKSDNYGLTFSTTGPEFILSNTTLLSGLTSASISMWLNIDSISATRGIFSLSDGAANDEITLSTFNSRLYVRIRNASTNFKYSSDWSSQSANTWIHLCLVYDGSETEANKIKVYLNNSLINFGSATGSTPATLPTFTQLTIGNDIDGNDFNGSISEVAVFDYALSSTQISTLYGSSSLGSGNPMALKPQPVAYYPLGDNSASNPLTQPNEAVEDASVFEFSTQDYIEKTVTGQSPLGISGNITFSGWFKTSETTGYGNIICEDSFGQATKRNWSLVRRNNDLQAILFAVSGSGESNITIRSTGVTVGDGNWHFALATWDGTTNTNSFKLFIDGVLRAQDTPNLTAIQTGAAPLSISDNTASYDFIGQLSNIQIWDTNLTYGTASSLGDTAGGEVAELYNSGVPLLTGTQPQASSLRAWYKLDQSANWEADSSGNWQIPDAVSAYPQSFDFDGSTSYITYNRNPSISTSNVTISGWFKTDSTNLQGIVGGGGNDGMVIWLINGAKLAYYHWTSGGWGPNMIYPVLLNLNEWYHFAATWDESTTTRVLYLNGEPVLTNTTTTDLVWNNNYGYLGRYSSFEFDGQLSNIQIHNSTLPATGANSIQTLYNNGVPLETAIDTSNLYGWWKLDNTATWTGSAYSVPDESVNGNTGTSSGMTEQNLVNNNVSVLNGESSGMTSANLVLSDLTRAVPYDSYSFNFDSASSDYIQTTSNSLFNGLTAFSISCWIKRNGTQQSYAAVLSYQTSTSQYLKLNFHTYTDKIEMSIRPGSTSPVKVISSAGSIPDGEWVHIAVVGDANNLSNLNMYINGVLDNDVTSGNITTLAQSSDIYIGTDAGAATTREFNGKISNVSIFNEALTSTEVLKLYANGVPQDLSSFTPQPISWWPLGSNSFWNGSQWIVRDMIGSNDGTGQNIGVDGLVGDAPRSEANGTGTNMDIESNIALSTKWSSNNSISINMSSEARIEDTP